MNGRAKKLIEKIAKKTYTEDLGSYDIYKKEIKNTFKTLSHKEKSEIRKEWRE